MKARARTTKRPKTSDRACLLVPDLSVPSLASNYVTVGA
jgi:hypothetical protein